MEPIAQKLFMVLVGCTPPGRLTEQHDIYFGIAVNINELAPQLYNFWPNGGTLHIDAWREVTKVGECLITIVPKNERQLGKSLFFLNLGGYKAGEFEEYHHKVLVTANTMAEAVKEAKRTLFYKTAGFKGAESHIDEKYALDVDDAHKVEDVLPAVLKERFSIVISEASGEPEDELHIGYLKIKRP